MITQVFPDEFHLNTLDKLLSAIARLNPHVNIKAIVIGLMDRLSSYAARESESEPPEDRKQTEEDATVKLLEKLRLSKEKKEAKITTAEAGSKPTNGDHVNGEESAESQPSNDQIDKADEAAPSEAVEEPSSKKQRGVPENVKLYEIFYDQVVNLVTAQRLHIQDTIALLVSLANLAL